MGDQFVSDVFESLQTIRLEDKEAQRRSMYIYDFYNVIGLTTNQENRSFDVMANFMNAVIKGLNKYVHLPRIIVFIPDGDLLRYFDHFTFGVSAIANICLKNLITNVDRLIQARKDALRLCRPGALAYNEPKLIWVNMMNRVNVREPDQLLAMRKKFNAALNAQLETKRNHYAIDITDEMNKSEFFTSRKQLTPLGKETFWRTIDMVLEKFDVHKISLRPGTKVSDLDLQQLKEKKQKNDPRQQRKMPTPPPKLRKELYR